MAFSFLQGADRCISISTLGTISHEFKGHDSKFLNPGYMSELSKVFEVDDIFIF